MAGPGNTPYQVGPGEDTDVVIPGKVGFYGETPVSQASVAAPPATTTNLTTAVANLHATQSQILGALNDLGLVNRT